MATFRYVFIDETKYLTDDAKKLTGTFWTPYIFNSEVGTHCCELHPSYWMEAVGIDTENKVEDDLHTELSSYLHESDHYRHVCHALKEAPILGEFEDMDEAREYASGNPPCDSVHVDTMLDIED